jgi:RimJ/RimL family protein N-acetyltransferase/8-oxo-dGTP pyrophosphatase MutT (NUDIX family)
MVGMTRTWDGLEVAADEPHGSSVVVRRLSPTGDIELLLLHRNANGPDFDGDWAWTSPAGARQPGEAVYPAALRELAEEAGLDDLQAFAIDLSGAWAVFGADLDRETTVELVDPEHDRYEWLSPTECRDRVLPSWVADVQVTRGSAVPMSEVTFRAMRHDDLASVVSWQQAPHADRWFHGDALTLEAAELRYGPRLDGDHPVRMSVLQVDGHDAGYLQHYQVADADEYAVKTRHPEAIGFDYLIGDPAYIGHGLGTRMIWTFLRDVVIPAHPEAPRFVASPDHRNQASRRVLAKCGFVEGDWIDMPNSSGEGVSTEVVCTLDRAHWFG